MSFPKLLAYTETRPTLWTVVQPLRRCQACHAPHPRALDPNDGRTDCHHCGEPLAPLERPQVVRMKIMGNSPAAILSRALVAIGDWLRRIAER